MAQLSEKIYRLRMSAWHCDNSEVETWVRMIFLYNISLPFPQKVIMRSGDRLVMWKQGSHTVSVGFTATLQINLLLEMNE